MSSKEKKMAQGKKKKKDEGVSDKSRSIKKLYKSQRDRMIGGVCGGISEYLNVDSTFIRIIFVLMGLFGGSGIIIYIAGLIIIPEGTTTEQAGIKVKSKSNTAFWGVLLIILGIFFLVPDFGVFGMHNMWMWHGLWRMILPITVIALGAWLLLRPSDTRLISAKSTGEKSKKEEEGIDKIRLTRSLSDRKISGVCGGLGNYFNIDSTIIRILWIVATIGSFGFGILAYVIMMIALPEDESEVKSGA